MREHLRLQHLKPTGSVTATRSVLPGLTLDSGPPSCLAAGPSSAPSPRDGHLVLSGPVATVETSRED